MSKFSSRASRRQLPRYSNISGYATAVSRFIPCVTGQDSPMDSSCCKTSQVMSMSSHVGQDRTVLWTVLWTVHAVPPHKSCLCVPSHPVWDRTEQSRGQSILYHCTSHVCVPSCPVWDRTGESHGQSMLITSQVMSMCPVPSHVGQDRTAPWTVHPVPLHKSCLCVPSCARAGQRRTVPCTVHPVPPHKSCLCVPSRPMWDRTGQSHGQLYQLTSHVYVSVPSRVGQPIDSPRYKVCMCISCTWNYCVHVEIMFVLVEIMWCVCGVHVCVK